MVHEVANHTSINAFDKEISLLGRALHLHNGESPIKPGQRSLPSSASAAGIDGIEAKIEKSEKGWEGDQEPPSKLRAASHKEAKFKQNVCDAGVLFLHHTASALPSLQRHKDIPIFPSTSNNSLRFSLINNPSDPAWRIINIVSLIFGPQQKRGRSIVMRNSGAEFHAVSDNIQFKDPA